MQCGHLEQRGARRMVPRFLTVTKCMITSFSEGQISRYPSGPVSCYEVVKAGVFMLA